MSIEELMNFEVTSVSRRPERLFEAASAVQVITRADIQRSGAATLPEALRLASNLQVGQLNSFATIISARGFNALFANKLLVMIDGRVVYTPLFAGVFWDVQNVVLEDVDRIEVISGPGGALWGANAVNGVINIITRSAADTQGLLASVAVGSFLKDQVTARYGGRVGERLFFRIYAQHFDRDNTFLADGQDHADAWRMTHGGFRMDWLPSEASTLTLQGDLYGGALHTLPNESSTNGQHVLASWTRTFSAGSDLRVQAYFDRTWRYQDPGGVTDALATADLDAQHRFPLARRHSILWGAGYRLMGSEVRYDTTTRAFLPPRKTLQLFSAFVQDDVTLVPGRLKVTVGTKLEHNTYSGLEVQPGTRLTWTPDARQTIWSAVSRAVRSPSRIDKDFYIPGYPVPPPDPSVAGGPHFDSEKLVAYELGYRVQPAADLSLAVAAFYNTYDDLYSVEALPGTRTYQIQNGSEGDSWGAELSGTYQPAPWWRLRGGYTYVYTDLRSKPGRTFDTSILADDPKHQFLLQSMLDLPGRFQLDVVSRYVSERPARPTPSYFTFDARLAWLHSQWEFAIVGQNLWEKRHSEFAGEQVQIPRGIYGRLTWRYQ